MPGKTDHRQGLNGILSMDSPILELSWLRTEMLEHIQRQAASVLILALIVKSSLTLANHSTVLASVSSFIRWR